MISRAIYCPISGNLPADILNIGCFLLQLICVNDFPYRIYSRQKMRYRPISRLTRLIFKTGLQRNDILIYYIPYMCYACANTTSMQENEEILSTPRDSSKLLSPKMSLLQVDCLVLILHNFVIFKGMTTYSPRFWTYMQQR